MTDAQPASSSISTLARTTAGAVAHWPPSTVRT
jgi:hypothetical protein